MEDDQQFCLRWNNHQSTLIQNFDTLLESGTLVDCTLAAEGKYLKAHKVVLSACSPYFEGLLSEHYDKHPVFILKDVKFKELKAMMDYMYRGEVNISQDQLTALLKAAESLQIKGLSDSKTGGSTSTSGKGSGDSAPTRQNKSTAGQAAANAAVVDIPHASSGLTIEKNKVPRQSLQQVSVSDLPEDSASPQVRGVSSREGSTSPSMRKRKRQRRRSLNDDNNSMENHEASNSSDANLSAPALGVAAVAEDKTHADPADPVGRSALMQQLTKPADDMCQIAMEKPEPTEEIIQPKSEYLDDQESVEDLTHLDDDLNDMEMDQDNSRAGPSTQDAQHPGMAHWHMTGDRSNTSVGAAAGGPGTEDVYLAAQDAVAAAQRDSQGKTSRLSMISLLRRNRKKTPKAQQLADQEQQKPPQHQQSRNQRPATRNHLSERFQHQPPRVADLYNDNSLDSLVFAASLGLVSTQRSTKVVVVPDTESIADISSDDSKPQIKQIHRNQAQNNQALEFHCRFCGKGYRWKSTMRRHETLECGDKPPSFQCPQCAYRARQRGNLTVHIKRHHMKD